MFYVTVVPSTLLLLVMLFDLRKTTKHDKVLYRFCQIRRDITTMMFTDGSNLSKSDYRVLRTTLDVTSSAIHNFNHYKTTLFNFRWFMERLKEYRKNASKIDRLATSNERINNLKKNLALAMFCAFLSYTPLIRSQLLVELFLAVLSFMIKIGFKSFNLTKGIEYLSWLKEEFKDFSHQTPQHA